MARSTARARTMAQFVQDEQMQDLAQYALLAKAGQTYLHWLESKIKEE